jgi:hypothetical protein
MKSKRAIEEKARNELNYRKAVREVTNCQTQVRQQSEALKKSACELEQNGRHSEALTSVRFSRVLSNLDQRIGSYLQRLSFCHTMLSVGNGLNSLTDMCNGLITSMKRLPLGNLMNNSTGGIEKALLECEQFMDRVDLSMPSLD